jgi:uncharacterized metal-binding protein YceD (DUF177 family)
MKSSATGSSTYRSLAQQHAEVERALEIESLPRLKALCGSAKNLSAKIKFDQDDQGRIRFHGETSGTVSLGCHRCEGFVDSELASTFVAVIAFNEGQAQQWQTEGLATEVIVVQGPNLDVAELIEDEFLLAIPERVCLDEECENMPAMFYGAEEGSADPADGHQETERRFPFAGLKEAMSDASDNQQ